MNNEIIFESFKSKFYSDQEFTIKDEPLITKIWAVHGDIYDDFMNAKTKDEVENAYRMSEKKYKEHIQKLAATYFAKFRIKQIENKDKPVNITIDEVYSLGESLRLIYTKV